MAVVNGPLALIFRYMEWVHALAQTMKCSCPAALVSPVQSRNKSSTDTSVPFSSTTTWPAPLCQQVITTATPRSQLIASWTTSLQRAATQRRTFDWQVGRQIGARHLLGPFSNYLLQNQDKDTRPFLQQVRIPFRFDPNGRDGTTLFSTPSFWDKLNNPGSDSKPLINRQAGK